MDENNERRTEKRLHYRWSIWFAEDFSEELSQGRMVDISSRGAAFACHADRSCPYVGQHITTRFSIPRFKADDSFGITGFIRPAHVCRLDNVSTFLRHVAIQFDEPLPLKPGEQENISESDAQKMLGHIAT